MNRILTIIFLGITVLGCRNDSNNPDGFLSNNSSNALTETGQSLARARFDSLWNSGWQKKWDGQANIMTDNFNECLMIARTLNNDTLLARVYLAMSGYYDDLGDYNQEIDFLDKALEKLEASKNYIGCATVYNNMAWAYVQACDYDKGIAHAHKGIAYLKKLPEDSLKNKVSSLINATLALAFLEEHQADSALKYNQLAFRLLPFLKRGKLNQYCWLLSTFGNIYMQKKDYVQAENNFKKVLVYKDSGSTADAIVFTIGKYCQLLNRLNRQPEAIEIGRDGIRIAQKTGLVRYQIDIADAIRASFESLKKTDSAYLYSKIATALRDSVFNSRKSIQLQSMTFDRDLKAKELRFEIEKAKSDEQLRAEQKMKNTYLLGFVFVLLIAVLFFYQRNKIRAGKILSDELLLNILPEEVAEELKQKGSTEAKNYDQVTIMFTDFKNFTHIAEKLTPQQLVNEIDTCFKAFDLIIEKYRIEKIKTIGDAYMCAGGLPIANTTHTTDVIHAALEIQQFMQEHIRQRQAENKDFFEIRIGIHTGPVVAGIVGLKKYAYDIWGDTVNIASRMESSGEAGKVNISGETYEHVKDTFKCTYRGKIQAKNKGEIDMYFVESVA